MYDIKWIREHPEAFDRGLIRRGLEPLAGKLLALDEKRRAAITKAEQAQARRNAASKEIGQAKAKKDEATAQKLMAEVAALKDDIVKLEADAKKPDDELNGLLATIPNTPLDEPDVPTGTDAKDNVEYRRHGEEKKLVDEKGNAFLKNEKGDRFKPKQHFELGEALGMMDFELAAKLSGARFVVLQKGLARMERALGQFFLDVHTGPIRKTGNVDIGGYTEVNPPLMVRDDVMFGTAQLPKFADDQFAARRIISEKERWRETANAMVDRHSKGMDASDEMFERLYDEFPLTDNLWLIPTAEVPLTNLVRESIVDEDKLPLRLTACTPCFRAEAGAAGKDTRGMIRQHQFTKVELVSITTPEKSKEEHERMLACAEEVLKQLDLHYRVVTLCTGDMGFAAQKTYDIEVWLPGQNMYREISSCSVCGDFQARRMHPPGKPNEGARYKGKDGKVKGFVHTLNGSGVAVGRALIAVMETYQQEDGSILVPEALKPYMGGVTKIEKVA